MRDSASLLLDRPSAAARAHCTEEEVAAVDREGAVQPSTEAYCIFQQPWWLEAVAPGAWGEVTVDRDGAIVARLPYVINQNLGLTVLTMPLLTPRLGPWLRPSKGSAARRLADEKELMRSLIAQLPRFDLFRQNFTADITNWLPFHWAGFEQTTNYTYRLENLKDLDAVWSGLDRATRNQVRKAEKIVKVRTGLGLDRLLEMNAKTFGRQGQRSPYSGDLVRRIDAACAQRNCRQIFIAEDAQGNTHAASYAVWDDRFVYGILSGSDPALRSSGAGSLLIWKTIQLASQMGKSFDFEGSMMEPVEHHFRNWGAQQVPYFRVWKMSRRMKALNAGREFWEAIRGE